MTIRNILLTAALLVNTAANATQTFISFQKPTDGIALRGASIGYDKNEDEGVLLAIKSLQNDMKSVLGFEPAATSGNSDATLLIGTFGRSTLIDKADDLNALKGKHEMFIIKATGNQIVVAGSDKRGTIYGIYELSRQLGVSPWYWWADVPVEKHTEAYVVKGSYTDGEPAVELRGIFINDEAPCLTGWVKNTFGTTYGGHKFYEKVFELILRLRGNMMWPAMWNWAFYSDDPENSRTADKMGIMIGTSHHEPMARNHQEYARNRKQWGDWNYKTNQKNLDKFFREGIERIKGTEDIVTIGMRGDGDEAMSNKTDTRLMEQIVGNQRKIIRQVTGKPAAQTTQVWALYKEVQDYYDAGFRVPDDVCMLVCDDNWGNIRRVPNETERKHKGGWGIYYHVDYVGAPRNTKWINVTQTQQMFEQLSLAYDFGIRRMWILNVGDIKPMEYPIQLFLDMAWNPKAYSMANITGHTTQFFTEAFGEYGKEAAYIYNLNSKYMGRVTPEMLDAQTYNISTGEWKQVCDDYLHLELRATRLFERLPEPMHDAYRQLLLFPVSVMANLYEMYYAQAMNHELAGRRLAEANKWADKVRQCFTRDSMLCRYYNKEMSNGKWNGMMTQKHIGYTSWNDNFPADTQPMTTRIESDAKEHRSGGYIFSFNKKDNPQDYRYISIEAEHFYQATAPSGTSWEVYPDYGRTLSGVALTPYTSPVGDASLTYRFDLPEDIREVKVHVIVKSTLDFLNVGGFEYDVALDNGSPVTVNFNKTLVDRQPYMYSEFYPTVARRVVENTVGLPVGKEKTHLLKISPRHPGIVFEKIVIDFGGYQDSHLFGNESFFTRE